MTNTEMQKSILNKLMFVDDVNYSELHRHFENHDLFNYHLRELTNKGYLQKTDGKYSLTAKGKQTVSMMEEDGEYQKQFKVGMFIGVVREENGKTQMLLHKRLKHPHYGSTGMISGKLKWGDALADNLQRELGEEVGLKANSFTTLGVARENFYDENKIKVADGVFFVIIVNDWSGEPSFKSLEGEYFWYDVDKILLLENIFRSTFKIVLDNLDRFMKDKGAYTPYISENSSVEIKF